MYGLKSSGKSFFRFFNILSITLRPISRYSVGSSWLCFWIGTGSTLISFSKYFSSYPLAETVAFNMIESSSGVTVISKGIQGPLSDLTGFGWKFVEKNKKIIFGKRKKNPQKRINNDY